MAVKMKRERELPSGCDHWSGSRPERAGTAWSADCRSVRRPSVASYRTCWWRTDPKDASALRQLACPAISTLTHSALFHCIVSWHKPRVRLVTLIPKVDWIPPPQKKDQFKNLVRNATNVTVHVILRRRIKDWETCLTSVDSCEMCCWRLCMIAL